MLIVAANENEPLPHDNAEILAEPGVVVPSFLQEKEISINDSKKYTGFISGGFMPK